MYVRGALSLTRNPTLALTLTFHPNPNVNHQTVYHKEDGGEDVLRKIKETVKVRARLRV